MVYNQKVTFSFGQAVFWITTHFGSNKPTKGFAKHKAKIKQILFTNNYMLKKSYILPFKNITNITILNIINKLLC